MDHFSGERAPTRRLRRLSITENRYEPYPVPLAGRGGERILTINDSLSYLEEVKETFPDRREKYDEFIQLLKDHKKMKINVVEVIARVKELFRGHKNLIIGFNNFLPESCKIALTDEGDTPSMITSEFEEAMMFVSKVKMRFRDDDQVYQSFLDILNLHRKEHKSIHEVRREVAALFMNHPDLFDEFMRNFSL